MPTLVDRTIFTQLFAQISTSLQPTSAFSNTNMSGTMSAPHDLSEFFIVEQKPKSRIAFFDFLAGCVEDYQVIAHVDLSYKSKTDDVPNKVKITCYAKNKNKDFITSLASELEKKIDTPVEAYFVDGIYSSPVLD